ncbi:MAG TPA: hypothetical protein VFQ88_13000 [Nevskiaceae bacterium]|nr:hypothetical protein [Nevskiaceae bacterium]
MTPPADAGHPPINFIVTADTLAWTANVDGHTVLYITPKSVSTDAPVLVALTYPQGQPVDMANLMQAGRLAADDGAFVVIPAVPGNGQWQDDNPLKPASAGTSDLHYITDVIQTTLETQPTDPARIYMTGYSNSAFMAERYACQSGQPLAGLALVAATQRATIEATCAPVMPLREVAFSGTSDRIVPYDGIRAGPGFGPYGVYGAQQTEQLWQTREGCNPAATTTTALPINQRDGTSVTLSQNTHCNAGAAVALYTIHGGGHTWPGNPFFRVDSVYLGTTTHNLDATLAMWAFFTDH